MQSKRPITFRRRFMRVVLWVMTGNAIVLSGMLLRRFAPAVMVAFAQEPAVDDVQKAREETIRQIAEAVRQTPGADQLTKEKIFVLLSLNDRNLRLDAREALIAEKESQLLRVEGEIDSKITQLSGLRTAIDELLQQRDVKDQAKVDKLVTMVEAMRPDKAAPLLDRLDEDLAVAVLGKIKGRIAGKVLGNLPAEKAARLSEQFTKSLPIPNLAGNTP